MVIVAVELRPLMIFMVLFPTGDVVPRVWKIRGFVPKLTPVLFKIKMNMAPSGNIGSDRGRGVSVIG
jgi:hypothetical protein